MARRVINYRDIRDSVRNEGERIKSRASYLSSDQIIQSKEKTKLCRRGRSTNPMGHQSRIGTQDVHHQAKACQKAEAKQTDSPMGEDEDW
ncbi:hypothetical protein DMN91_008987 [Ooceraea biroi]|uniref:Uncharacterized protein n=1 Tax=Ooceraea biroi TaxID=2015173 RepID=A0A3L8DDR4_OOCBI|nr:hypothetical protein DMN91_008987 [Ooceraea biroi]